MTYALQYHPDGSVDVLLQYSREDAEFGLDFLSPAVLEAKAESLAEFLEKQGKNLRLNAVKIVVAGVLAATIPAAAALYAAAAAPQAGKYSMAYLYLGNAAQQLQYINNADISLHVVAPSWFDIRADGSILASGISSSLVSEIHRQGIRVVPFLSNHWDRAAGIRFLQDVQGASTQLAEYVHAYNLDGLNVDIENVTHNERAQYTEFVHLLREKIPAHKEVSVAVAANPKGWTQGWHGSYDYAALGKYADHLFLMTYDESWQGGPAGPMASLGFVEDSVKYALRHVPANKVVLGLPLFGRLWSDTGFHGNGVYLNLGAKLIAAYDADIRFDAQTQSPCASFTVNAGDTAHTVNGKTLTPGSYTLWFENRASIEKKLGLVTKYNLKGAGSWALGQETAEIWQDYSSVLNNRSAAPPKQSVTAPQTAKPQTPTTTPAVIPQAQTPTAKPAARPQTPPPTAVKPAVPTKTQPSQAAKPQSAPASAADTPTEAAVQDILPDTLAPDETAPPALLTDEVNLPRNLVETAEIVQDAAVYDAPGGKLIGRIAAGSLLFLFGVSASGYYKIRRDEGWGYILHKAVKKSSASE